MSDSINSNHPAATVAPSLFWRILPWFVAVLVLILDRLSKTWVIDNLEIGSFLRVCPSLALTHVHNRGIAFSLFADGGPLSRVILHAVILSAVVLIAWMLVRQPHQRRSAIFAFGLILGGAIGNLIDRILYGWVVDFIHVWVDKWSWPDFNVADSAISVGAVLLVLSEFWPRKKVQTASDNDVSDSD